MIEQLRPIESLLPHPLCKATPRHADRQPGKVASLCRDGVEVAKDFGRIGLDVREGEQAEGGASEDGGDGHAVAIGTCEDGRGLTAGSESLQEATGPEEERLAT